MLLDTGVLGRRANIVGGPSLETGQNQLPLLLIVHSIFGKGRQVVEEGAAGGVPLETGTLGVFRSVW